MSELYFPEPPEGTGVNGSAVYTPEQVGSEALVLYTSLLRDTPDEQLEEKASRVESVEMLALITFHARDVLEGNGERRVFYTLFKHLYRRAPQVAHALVPLIPMYGAWFDMYRMFESHPANCWQHEPITVSDSLADVTALVYAEQLLKDYDRITKEPTASIGLAGKWAPREGKHNHWFFKRLLKKCRMNFRDYRRMVATLGAHIGVLEQKLCHDGVGLSHWSDIRYDHVPSLAMQKYRRAFECVPTNDTDRAVAFENFMTFLEGLKTEQATVHGKLLYPHDFVTYFRGKFDENQDVVVEAQWRDLVVSMRGRGTLSSTVVMADVSPSMQLQVSRSVTALDISIGLSILISEVGSGPFQHKIMTFDSKPEWQDLAGESTMRSKVKRMTRARSGLSTNFQKALNLLLTTLTKNEVPPGEEPKQLIVVTDMGWDGAAGKGRGPAWTSHIDVIRRRFEEEGGWKCPRIVIWNVTAKYSDQYHATATADGVSMISGWNSNLLKQFLDGKDLVDLTSNPYESMRCVLYGDRYAPVVEAVRSSM